MTSPFYAAPRGTCQGYPLPPLLFTTVLEPLAVMIREDPNGEGIKGVEEGMLQKLVLYADILLQLSNPL